MSDGFDDLDDELLGLGGGDDHSEASDGHHSDSESKAVTKQASGALSGDESEGAISDSTVGSQSKKRKVTTVVTSPSPPRVGDDDDDDGEIGGGISGKGGAGGRKRPSPGEDEGSPPKKRAKGPATGGRKGKKRRGSDDEDDDEDDDGSLSDTPSSAIVSEPISSDDEMADSPADLYPYDGIYKSAAEKAQVENFNQLQREQFIAERKEEVDKYRENEQMVNLARRKKLALAKKKKRAADDEDYDDSLHASAGARRSTRGDSSAKKSADSKKNASLSALRQKRDEKHARKAGGGDADRPKKRRDPISEGEDEESDNEHDDAKWAASQEKQSAPTRKGSEEATFDEVKLLMVTRNTITKYWTYPNFETATAGCFVRVSIGNHPDTGKLVYRLCQIKDWQDSKSIYEVSSGDRTIKFRRNAIIATGAAEKPTRVDVISDSHPTEDEWRWYIGAMEVAKLKRPDVAFIERKRKDVKNLITHQLTNEDFDAMRRMRTSYYPDDPVIPNLDLPSLKRRRQQLVDEGDEPEILRIDRELEWRAPPRALTAALSRPTQLDVLGQINKRNREINRQDIRKAQIEEKKRNEIAARMAAENGDSSFMDPFARVKTHAKIYHNEKPKDKDGDVDDLFEDDGDKEKEKQKNGGGAGLGKTDSKVPQVKVPQNKGIDAAIASMDLEFDIDFSDI
ncbi:hypothetical protein EYR41_004558 [Orbilia oligospora]|uniref:Uncharacterized protein n=1 Tax=Orbilia oligospora TaxID=2813651 RepID=A0A7C8KT18_ORBOL|nr:hypothetical protein TWF751_005311 [Orbilia oligospora]TGJ72681.1 hypothetical protein EYR41_004558 [Orbilia oligospora]